MANPRNNRLKFVLSWNRFQEHLQRTMSTLMVDSAFSDVIITTGDKRMVYGHLFVLAHSSNYFHRLLRQMSRHRGMQLVIALPEINYNVLKVLMNYMYRGETQVSYSLLPLVIKAGRMLEINGLKELQDAQKVAERAGIRFNNAENNQPPRPALRLAREGQQGSHAQPKPSARAGAPQSAEGQARPQPEDEFNEPIVSHGDSTVHKFRPILPKDETVAENAKTESIKLPVKRKCPNETPEEVPKFPPPTATATLGSRNAAQQQNPIVRIKREKFEGGTWHVENVPPQEIDIKTEIPFEIDEMNNIHFPELFCEVCKEGFSTHDGWVRHAGHQRRARMQLREQCQQMEQMQQLQQLNETDQLQQLLQLHHMLQAVQTEQTATAQMEQNQEPEQTEQEDDQAENDIGPDAVYHCVICSEAVHSTSDWIQHMRAFHTNAEPLKEAPIRRGRDRDPRINK